MRSTRLLTGIVAALAALPLVALPLAAVAQTVPVPATTPSPAASPVAASDPCASILAVVTRPSVTTSACAVKNGDILIESGYQNTTADGGGNTVQVPQALVRFGTKIDRLELAVMLPQRVRAGGLAGSSDVAFGAKYELGYSAKFVYGVNAFVSAPTGTNGFSAGGTGYTANANASFAISPVFSLASTLSLNALSNGTQRYGSFIPSLVLGATIAPNTNLFGEIASFSNALGPASATRVQTLVGVQHAFANRIQIDLEAGRSATVATGTYRYVGAGLSYLY